MYKSIFNLNLILFLLLACFWSGSYIGIKAAVDFWPPLFSAGIRVTIALLCLMLIAVFFRKSVTIPLKLRIKLWIIGLVAQGIPFCFLFWGEQYISPGLTGILNGTTPIWTFILAFLFLPTSTAVSPLKILGLLLGMSGIIIIFWPLLTFDKSLNIILGAGAILLMALSYATATILNQRLFTGKIKVDFFTNLYHQHVSSASFLVLMSFFFEKWPSLSILTSSYTPWLACLYLGIFATAFAFMIYYHLIRAWDALRASCVLYIIPVLTLFWDYQFFGNMPGQAEIIGVTAILTGVVFIQLASLRKEFIQNKIGLNT